jgi:Tol biopolymer transport system component
VLDFGLAKSGGSGGDELTHSPTVMGPTVDGVLLGTAPYMSPEQARGKTVDKRTDIWAFGCVLYEMLTGRRAFDGETTSDTIAAILEHEPDWAAFPPSVAPAVRRLVQRCLDKDARRRLRDIADARGEIEDGATAEVPQSHVTADGKAAAAHRPSMLRRLGWAAAPLVVLGILIGGALTLRRPASLAPITVKIAVPAGSALADPGRLLGPPVVSPDGRTIAVSLRTAEKSRLFIRRLDSDRLTQLEGTDGAAYPAWSPDGTSISFFADEKLKMVPASGGTAIALCTAPSAMERGAAWAPDGTIVLGINGRGIFRCPKDGGQPIEITTLNKEIGENSHRYPVFLPDSRRFLYYARTDDVEKRAVYLESLDRTPPRKRVLVADGQFALGRDPATGAYYLVTQQAGRVFAQPFDVRAGEAVGTPLEVLDRAGQVTASDTGVLVVRPEAQDRSRLVWFDRGGRRLGILGDATDYWQVELSPDDQRLAAVKHNYLSGSFAIWIASVIGGQLEPFSSSRNVLSPVWSPDSKSLYFHSGSGRRIVRKFVDSTEPEELVETTTSSFATRHISANARALVVENSVGSAGRAIYWRTLDGTSSWRQFASGGTHDEHPHLSPDGHWLAYASDRTGSAEVYVGEFPDGRAYRISRAGGQQPRWRADGKELFYIANGDSLAAVDLTHGLEAPASMVLFQVPFRRGSEGPLYDVTSDGQRFIVIASEDVEAPDTIDVILNWPALMHR